VNDFVFYRKIEEMRQMLNKFSRCFNLAVHCSKDIDSAQKEMCVFFPKLSHIDEVMLIVNPLYNE
jgi:hypothetical protein